MSDFPDISFKYFLAHSIALDIMKGFQKCIETMVADCEMSGIRIKNNEDEISNYLFKYYLNDDTVLHNMGLDNFYFERESPENYTTNNPIGRADFRVINSNGFRPRKNYFLIECKRLDGDWNLNNEYIKEGILRFNLPSLKYLTPTGFNGMAGYIVKSLNKEKNVGKINKLLAKYLDTCTEDFLVIIVGTELYSSMHGLNDSKTITLIHSFVDCSAVVSKS